MNQDFFQKEFDNINKYENRNGILKYKCHECGNKIVTKNSLSNCVICNSSGLSIEEYREGLEEDFVLPFSKTIVEARNIYKKKVLFNPMIPIIFKKKETINCIKKIYVKSTILNLNVNGETVFLAIDKGDVKKEQNSQRKYRVVLDSNLDYDDVIVTSISNMNEGFFNDVGDYKFEGLVKYDISYLNDESYILDNDRDGVEKIKNNIIKCSLNVVHDALRHDLGKLEKNNLVVSVKSKKEILLPMYVLNIKYRNKDYCYMMNGVSGQDISDFPIGKLELTLFSLGLFLIIFGIALLIAYFL